MRNMRKRSGESDSHEVVENGRGTPESNVLADAPDTSDAKKPFKKRKLDDSPPWKSATTQTPTAFIVNGRRRSGRTNAVPPELLRVSQNGTPTRAKRTPLRQAAQAPTLPGRQVSRSSASQSASKQTNGRTRHQSPMRASSRLAKPTPPQSSKLATIIKSPSVRKPAVPGPSTRPRAASKSTPTKPPKPSPAVGTRKSARALKKAVAAAEEELAGSKRRLSDPHGSDGASSFDSDGELEVGSGIKLPSVKVKVKFGVPKPVITHPSQIPGPRPFASFEEFLQQDDPAFDEALLEKAVEDAQQEAEIRDRIEHEARYGVLTRDMCSLFLQDKQPEPELQYGHHEHLVAHALNFRRLMAKERKEHQELMRKRNVALMAEIKRRRPRTREEVEQEEYVENRKTYKEQIAQLRRKWDEVMKEVERRRIQRAEEDRRQAGKEHLNLMLEHSTQLLDARRGDRMGSVVSVSELDGEDELLSKAEASSDNEDNDAESSDVNEDMMSTSESESDADVQDDDANLTVEQLRAKYAGLASTSGVTTEEPSGDEMEVDYTGTGPDTPYEAGSDVDMPDERPAQNTVDDASGEEVEVNGDVTLPELDEVDDILLEDSDASTDMDSGSDTTSTEDETDDEDQEDEDEGLLGFYGGMGGLTPKGGKIDDDSDGPYMEEGAATANQHEYNDSFDEDEDDEVQLVYTGNSAQTSSEENFQTPDLDVETSEEGIQAEADRQATQELRLVELENDDVTPKPVEGTSAQDALPVTERLDLPDVETTPSISQPDAKDAALQSSPTTTPEATPQPQPVVKTPIPFLLCGTLREYQHYGLDWLAGLYSNHTNGILADEMGLGKTIQTIALLAHLACEKGVWGPHLIVVPTSVMLNWEMEFKKWAPGFKILTYYGSREQRAEKRKGWYDNNLWHVCITSYQLVLQDQVTFKRRNWHYLILDEAHNIKNFRSQRWQTLLNFKSEARLLLTGTPLQNNLVELWSLLYFLMPSGSTSLPAGFANLNEFQEWFAHPVEQLIEGGREGMDAEAKNTVTKLHKVLRPYLLRRLKADVEKQMPAKYEHVVYCRLSKRQRYLYDDFMSMAKTRETLASGNYLSIINCLMQLRKVCNHPDLFETRQIVTSFAMKKSVVADYELKELLVRRRLLAEDPFEPLFSTDFLEFVGLVPSKHNQLTKHHAREISALSATGFLKSYYDERATALEPVEPDFSSIEGTSRYMRYQSEVSYLEELKSCVRVNRIRTRYQPLCSRDLVEVCTRDISTGPLKPVPKRRDRITDWFLNRSEIILGMIPTLAERADAMETTITKFGCITPAVVATDMAEVALAPGGMELVRRCQNQYSLDPFHEPRIRLSIAFPDKRLLQYDCGKLQRLDGLLRELQVGGHRALIFTQMTKVLDILEQFLNIHGHRYLRLDGATKVEQRQALTDRFNNDPRILVFILSTRSGGLGINLTGADTVIFYDLDWNPAMDKQCQDRCHRIGQTRDVHIYRFVSEYTIESNILRKSDQKRMLDDVVIQEGDFTTDYFNKLTIRDMLGDEVVDELHMQDDVPIIPGGNVEKALEAAEDVEDVAAAKVAQKEVVDTDVADFADRGTPQTPKETPAPVAATREATSSRDVSIPAGTTATTPQESLAELEVNTGLGHDIYGEGWGRVEHEPDHIDDYMIRHMEWELVDVPVTIPDKSKRKRSKKGKKF